MAVRSKAAAAEFTALARRMCFSNESIERLLEGASAAGLRCVEAFIADELEVRARNKVDRLFRRARFPWVKSLEEFDFSEVAFPEGYGREDLLGLGFLDAAQDFVFHGQTGRGKTHLAVALGIAAVNKGKAVRFYTVAELALALQRADESHSLDSFMRDFAKNDLVILDEFGYVPIDSARAHLLFQAFASCYEARSVILTTNIEFAKWGVVLGDDKLAAAMIDRVVHHGRLLEFSGASRRMEHALMLGKGE